MKIFIFSLLFSMFSIISHSQNNSLSAYQNLVNKSWKAEGKWGDGSRFKQEIIFKYSLDSSIVIAQSMGFTNKKQTEYGLRNHGIRQFDAKKEEILFWEFDVFGGVTHGKITVVEKDIIHQYQYGDSFVTDMWEYVNDSTYNFKVGFYDLKNQKWNQTFINTLFHGSNLLSKKLEPISNLQEKLVGNWVSKAWDGTLEENWKIGLDGHLHQSSKYIENGKILYEANSKIEVVGNDLVIFSIIKDSNPKIFKATSIAKNLIVFENSDYKNPNIVSYIFKDGQYKRTISGIENGKPSTYTFNFEKVEK